MIRLLQPLGLLAMASLVLPVAIHFMRRADRTVLEFAALRFLNESRHSRRTWELYERILLALRLLLLAALSLLLAVPLWRGTQAIRAHWLAVAPGADPNASEANYTVPLSDRHALASATPAATLASQIRELDAQLAPDTQLDVLVPEELGGLDAERLRLSHAMHWQIVPGRSPTDLPPPPSAAAPAIAIRADDAGRAELPVAQALRSAWSAAGAQGSTETGAVDTAAWAAPLPPQSGWLLWLGGPLSADATDWVKRGGRALVTRDATPLGVPVLRDDHGVVMFRERRVGRGRVLSTPQTLTVTAMPGLREPELAERLQSLLAEPLTAPDRAHASDVTPLQDSAPLHENARAPSASANANAIASAGRPFSEYAAVLAALLFLAERLWATRSPRARTR